MVDSLGDRLMFSLQYRNFSTYESLWVNHTVASGGVTGVRWYELRSPGSTPVLYQQGTYQPDSTYRWMGSLAVDKQGNMAVGYSVSSTTVKPSIRYAGRLVTDPLGTLPQGEASIIAGTGVQLNGVGRWGDYSKMTVDPVDDCTFWYTNEYYQVNSDRNWQTYIGSFKFPGCVCDPVHDAAFTWSPTSPFVGDLVTFNATAGGTEPIGYAWTFGDGGIGSGASATHTYTAAGDYSVTMTASNGCGQQVVQHSITVQPSGTLHLYRMKMNGAVARPPYYKVVTSGIIHNGTHARTVGVTVTGTYTYPDGSTEVKTTTSDSLGRFKFPVKKAQCGLYQCDVTSLSKAGYVDNPADDHVSRHTQITVACK
jgi:hypothetical protein